MTDLPEDYKERVYAGWLGKCIGVRLGAPVESWSYDFIQSNLGEIEDFLPLPPGKIFKPDDDTSFPMILVRAIEDYGSHLSSEKIGQIWLNYLGDQHGTLWWGGYGISSEHTAYMNLKAGIPAPLSGASILNGKAITEQIGGQIFSDIWGLIFPNDPEKAADYAEMASRVSHDGNGVLGGRFIAALTSCAFTESDPRQLVLRGLSVIPANSEYARVVQAVLEFYANFPNDWRLAYHFLAENFGYDKYPGVVPIIPNAGVVVLALLYGNGDFSRSVQVAVNAGWDTDCNAGNVGAIMGVAVGLDGIPLNWRKAMNDVLVISSIIGASNLTTIAECADIISRAGYIAAGLPAPSMTPRYHFGYPGTTQGIEVRSKTPRGEVIEIKNSLVEGGTRALKVILRKLNKKGEAQVYVRTYIDTNSLSSNFYGASFSPKIYPGQTIRARLGLESKQNFPLGVALYALDQNNSKKLQSHLTMVNPGESATLEYRIPPLENACLSEVGVVIHNLGDEVWNGSLWLEYLDWFGFPQFKDNFLKAKSENGAISQWTYLRGYWRKEEDGYHGSGCDVNETYTGDPLWSDYSFCVKLKPLLGQYHNVLFRVQGALRAYALGLAPQNKLCLYKKVDGNYLLVAEAPFIWEYETVYDLWIEGKGNKIQAGVSEKCVFEWEDLDSPYLTGMIGFSNFSGCHTCYMEYEIK